MLLLLFILGAAALAAHLVMAWRIIHWLRHDRQSGSVGSSHQPVLPSGYLPRHCGPRRQPPAAPPSVMI